jgi:hypothetical protein
MAQRPILFNAALARLADSAVAGLFMSELLFWWGKGSYPGWIYKTIQEIQLDTVLTRSEQDRAIRIWKRIGVLVVELKGIPRRRFFKIDHQRLQRMAMEHLANQCAKSNKLSRSELQAITESTPENTSRDLVLQTLRRTQNFDISAASKDLANKFSMNKKSRI